MGRLSRGKGLRRRSTPRKGHSLHVSAEILNARLAKEHCREERACQNPECPHPFAPWQAAHMVAAQEVIRLGFPKWNTMNVRRLCERCHHRHDHKLDRLPLTMLSQDNLDYAFMLMGERAFDYLHRHFSGRDPRLKEMLRRAISTHGPQQ